LATRPGVAGVRLLIVAIAALALSSCFASQQPASASIGLPLPVPGFWRGLWHGIIAPIAFLVSLFSDHVRVYAFPNSGRWYDFGFMVGIGGFSHGVWRGSARRKSLPPPKERDAAVEG
jgi:hypothetical protein